MNLLPFPCVDSLCLGNRYLPSVWSCSVTQKRRSSTLLLATLFAVILGVFAMHALTSHERAHAGHSAIPLAADVADVEHDGTHAETQLPQTDGSATDDPGSPSHDDGSGIAELCMALLCLMAALIALALSRGQSRRILYVVPRWIGPRIAALARSADPPCLHRLSILRC